MKVEAEKIIVLKPDDFAILDEDDFGVPGLVATELIGPFVHIQAVGPLIMVHDGVFEPHHGIGHHPHRFNERLFYILEGAVDHDDALNNITSHMGTGDLGRLTEGRRGMLHKEWNNTDGKARAFILVYTTDPTPEMASFALLRDADAPRYEESTGVKTKELVGARAGFPIHGDIRLFVDSILEPGAELEVELESQTGALVVPLEGDVFVGSNGSALSENAASLVPPDEGARRLHLRAPEGARLLRVIFGPGHGFVTR
jgi:redox-sensitive bicupin YhaK (pirin superfamily)